MSVKQPVHTRTQYPVHTGVYSDENPGTVDFKGLEDCRALYTLERILYDSFLKQKNLIIKNHKKYSTRVRAIVCEQCVQYVQICINPYFIRLIDAFLPFTQTLKKYTLPYTRFDWR